MDTKAADSSPFKPSTKEFLLRWSLASVCALLTITLASHFMTHLITPHTFEKKIYQFLSVDFLRIEPRVSKDLDMDDPLPPEEIIPEPPEPQTPTSTLSAPNLPKLSLENQALNAISMSMSFTAPQFDSASITPRKEVKAVFSEQLFPLLTPPPRYPKRAKRARIEGWVNISFTIDVDGSVKDVQVLSAEPEGIFENNTLRSVKNWKYKPQLLAGKATARRVVQTINFKLDK